MDQPAACSSAMTVSCVGRAASVWSKAMTMRPSAPRAADRSSRSAWTSWRRGVRPRPRHQHGPVLGVIGIAVQQDRAVARHELTNPPFQIRREWRQRGTSRTLPQDQVQPVGAMAEVSDGSRRIGGGAGRDLVRRAGQTGGQGLQLPTEKRCRPAPGQGPKRAAAGPNASRSPTQGVRRKPGPEAASDWLTISTSPRTAIKARLA